MQQVAKYFKDNNNLLRCLIVCSSSRSGISRSIYTSLLEDFFNLPYKKEKIDISLSENIVVEDIVTYLFPYIGKGENAEISKACSLSFLKHDFSEIYCTALNSIYKKDDKQYRLSKVYESTAFFACEYKFLDSDIEPEFKSSEADFSTLIYNWNSRNALIKRILRIYGTDTIILIKPKQFRYWLKSVALRDADETIAEAFSIL